MYFDASKHCANGVYKFKDFLGIKARFFTDCNLQWYIHELIQVQSYKYTIRIEILKISFYVECVHNCTKYNDKKMSAGDVLKNFFRIAF